MFLGGSLGLSAGRGTIVMGGASSSGNASRNQSGASANSSNPTKYMFVTSRPSTPVQVFEIEFSDKTCRMWDKTVKIKSTL